MEEHSLPQGTKQALETINPKYYKIERISTRYQPL